MRAPHPALLVLVALTPLTTGCGSTSKKTSPPAPRAEAPSVPDAGAYRYSTHGFERIDALLGARHSYPDPSHVTVAKRPCGYSERWSPIAQRSTQFDYCVSERGRQLRALTDFHEFFGYREGRRYRCSGELVPDLDHVRVGFRWVDRCKSYDTRLVLHGRVASRELLRVGEQRVKTIHLHVITRSSGHSRGTNVNDSWLERANGLLVRRSVSGEASTSTPIGGVHSVERFRIELRSPTPG